MMKNLKNFEEFDNVNENIFKDILYLQIKSQVTKFFDILKRIENEEFHVFEYSETDNQLCIQLINYKTEAEFSGVLSKNTNNVLFNCNFEYKNDKFQLIPFYKEDFHAHWNLKMYQEKFNEIYNSIINFIEKNTSENKKKVSSVDFTQGGGKNYWKKI